MLPRSTVSLITLRSNISPLMVNMPMPTMPLPASTLVRVRVALASAYGVTGTSVAGTVVTRSGVGGVTRMRSTGKSMPLRMLPSHRMLLAPGTVCGSSLPKLISSRLSPSRPVRSSRTSARSPLLSHTRSMFTGAFSSPPSLAITLKLRPSSKPRG
ncbi:MAG: hypothetical protein IPN85_13945 [Flavobacteriales bacterium]|nr:hypothetical protein [Flavobacteriales bacterium]